MAATERRERDVKLPTVVLVNGFLGAGRTTLLLKVASLLLEEHLRVAIVTNDQGDELVDTNWIRANGVLTEEVTRGCFCCRFSDFMNRAEELLDELHPDVIFAEPVGSCTDLAATVSSAPPLGCCRI